ncbi:MAG: hypothetical protein H6646_06935 [Anaerolineales bacterium]|nr:hypothetical protein [Anaerolineales bacterium]
MQARYHVQIMRAAIGDRFSKSDFRRIIRANLSQDRLQALVLHPEYHFDGGALRDAQAYISQQRRLAVRLLLTRGDRAGALDAFGRLTHARQDFYAHSNWTALWVAQHGGFERTTPEQIDICPNPLGVAGLFSGNASVIHFLACRVPIYGGWHARHLTPPDDHESMNLDHPGRGPLFPYAMAAATKHTAVELEALLRMLQRDGGPAAQALLLEPTT